MNKRIIWAAVIGLMVPYVGTLAWTGTIRGEYLPGVIARQMPVEFEPEALKAQAIIARTYICRQMEAAGEEEEIEESSLDMDYLESDQLKRLWGSSRFPQYYQKLESAVKATSGMVMTYEGKCIEPMYCRAAAGMTRNGDFAHPYFQSLECPNDVEAEGYMQILALSKEDFAARINSIPQTSSSSRQIDPSQIPDSIQIAARDEAGYIEELQIGGYSYTGEEVQYALGLQSAAFTLEPYEEQIRAASKGIGHGYGLSQWTANQKAKEGWKAEDILGYFYKNITLLSE